MRTIKVYPKPVKLDKDEVAAIISKRVMVGDESEDYNSYVSDEIKIVVNKDASLYLSDQHGEGYIYLYADQLDHIKHMVDKAIEVRNSLQ